MTRATAFWKLLKDHDYRAFSGVPCSLLQPLLQEAAHDDAIDYLPAVRENAAIGFAAGAWLAGRKAGVLMQNSGLGNVVNALTSCLLIYRIPVLMVVSWRGKDGLDAPEHDIMGRQTFALLERLDIPAAELGGDFEAPLTALLATAESNRTPVAAVVTKETFLGP